MKKMQLNVLFFFPSYGGNGGISSEVPDIRKWFAKVVLDASKDNRIANLWEETVADTPITMVRNQAVVKARELGADVLIMVDSDINPLKHADESYFQEFFKSSFDFLYDHYERGPVVVGAPYCGPPDGTENMYVFDWEGVGNRGDETPIKLEIIPRSVGARMFGIQPCGALPTGMIMYDMRIFKLIEPSGLRKIEILYKIADKEITPEEGLKLLHEGWFYYEWTDQYASQKASTEDVTNTRDISLTGCVKLGYNPVFCNWSSPVGHWKPWCVSGKPQIHDATKVAATFRRACENDDFNDAIVDASMFTKDNPIMKNLQA